MHKIFLDASVIFSALYSKSGGSRYIFKLSKKGNIQAATSETVIQEVERNLKKLDQFNKDNFQNFLLKYPLIIRESITKKEIKPYLNKVDKKDAHVIAGTILLKCKFLITLDKKHLNNPRIKKKFKEIEITSPKNFLQNILTL